MSVYHPHILAPFFANSPLVAWFDEERDPGTNGAFVAQVTATDYDDPTTDNAKLEYSIQRNKQIDGQNIFRIDPQNGKIFAMMRLDRENPAQRSFEIEIMALDHGADPKSGVGTVRIMVKDR